MLRAPWGVAGLNSQEDHEALQMLHTGTRVRGGGHARKQAASSPGASEVLTRQNTHSSPHVLDACNVDLYVNEREEFLPRWTVPTLGPHPSDFFLSLPLDVHVPKSLSSRPRCSL